MSPPSILPRDWPAEGGTSRAAPLVVLCLLVALAYLPALGAGFVWDDDSYVTANPTLAAPGGLARIWLEPQASPQYYPAVFTGFWLERRLWGLAPAGYHAVNVALHLANALLLWRLLARVAFPLPWLAAALFALHPVQVESVAWVAERKNVLSGAFYLLAALAFLPVLGIGEGRDTAPAGGRRLRRAWAAAFLCFVLALLAKSVTATLPAALLLLAWWRRGRIGRRDAALLGPFFAVGAASGLFTAWLERTHVGARGIDWVLTPQDRVVIAGKNAWFYLAKFLWPAGLSFSYPRWEPHAFPWWHLAAPLAVLALAAALWLWRGRIGRGPLAALGFFLVTVAPAIGFVDFYPMRFSFVADHFVYLALIGPSLAAAGAGAALARRAGDALPARAARGLALALALALAALTWERAGAFRDEETLWRDTLAKNPTSALALNNLGALLTARGAYEEALAHLTRALAAEPGAPDIRHNVGTALQGLGRLGEAETAYRAAVLAAPGFTRARVALALLLVERGRPAEAAEHLREVARSAPEYPDILPLLAVVLDRAGDADGAIAAFEAGLRREPGRAKAHHGLGLLLARRGLLERALAHLQRAADLDPGDPAFRYDLGNLLDDAGRPDEAERQYREALRLQPGYAAAHNNLGILLWRSGRSAEAASHFREALRLEPGFRDAAANLAALETGGR